VAELDDASVGFRRLRFASVNVEDLCRELDGDGLLTLWRAAEWMGLRWELVANPVARGNPPFRDGCVLVAEVDRFFEEHVVGSMLARGDADVAAGDGSSARLARRQAGGRTERERLMAGHLAA